MTDRLVGTLLLAIAVAFGLMARGLHVGFSDPLGPSAFPIVLAIPLALLSIYLIVRPDPSTTWITGQPLVRQLVSVAVLVSYSFVLEPLGFLLATFVALVLLGLMMGARLGRAALTAVVTSVALYILFDRLLGLPLPVGVLS